MEIKRFYSIGIDLLTDRQESSGDTVSAYNRVDYLFKSCRDSNISALPTTAMKIRMIATHSITA